MSKKISYLSLCLSLIFTLSAQHSIAASIESEGDLKVHGWIESTSGGFKFPDGTLLEAAGLNGFLFNVGFVVDDSNSNTGNLNSGAIKFGTGATGEAVASQRITSGTPSTDNINGLDFYTNSTARLSITNSGNVGIGTRTPAARLQVLSSDIVQAQFGANPIYLQTADGGGTSLLGFNLYWGSGKYVYGSSYTGATINNYSGGLIFGVAPAGTAGGSPPGGVYPTWVMRMTSEGKVRIGDSTNPSETLDVAGNIKASGNISAGAGATHTPLAYGVFDGAAGSRLAGSSNITCTWNVTRYECTIAGENYHYAQYITNVTPSGTSAIPQTASFDYKLLIYFSDTSGSQIKVHSFSVTVYKP